MRQSRRAVTRDRYTIPERLTEGRRPMAPPIQIRLSLAGSVASRVFFVRRRSETERLATMHPVSKSCTCTGEAELVRRPY